MLYIGVCGVYGEWCVAYMGVCGVRIYGDWCGIHRCMVYMCVGVCWESGVCI